MTEENVTGKTSTKIVPAQGTKVSNEKYKELYKHIGKLLKEGLLMQIPTFQTKEQFDKMGIKSYLHHEMTRGCNATGVKRIRIHDLRHSHVSLLINMGFSAVAIADRVGHESIDITYRYAHLFPTTQKEIANKLNTERG